MKIHILPARFGDSLIVDYGPTDNVRRILIDGGTAGTRKDIRKVLKDGVTELELTVVSHIDRDHIEGLLAMLEEDEPGFTTKDFWFNAWNHLPKNHGETFGAVQGERLSKVLRDKQVPWNEEFGRDAVKIPDDGDLPEVNLDGGMRLTLLGPTHQNLADLAQKWESEVLKANLDPGFGLDANDEEDDDDGESFDAVDIPDVPALANEEFEDDTSPANRSSIAFIAEHDGKRALFAGDACVETLLAGLNRFSADVIKFDLVKLPHHGSPHNISKELMEKMDCGRYVFSSNGSIFHHPHHVAVARAIEFAESPELIFNYRSDENEIWETTFIQQQNDYTTRYPEAGKDGLVIDL